MGRSALGCTWRESAQQERCSWERTIVINASFCLESHEAATCKRNVNPEERKSILIKFFQVFFCALKKVTGPFNVRVRFVVSIVKVDTIICFARIRNQTVREAQPSSTPHHLIPMHLLG